jgi:glycosyltransferase involved in cell wall biosynthesis
LKKKIVILNYEFPPIGGGGGVVSKKIAEKLVEEYEISIITSSYKDLPNFQTINNLKIYRLFTRREKPEGSNIFEMFLYLLLTLIPTLFILKKIKPDLIHCHFLLPTGFIAYLSWIFLKIPYVITLHGGDVPSFIPSQTKKIFSLVLPITKLILNKSRRNIVVSGFLRDLAKNDFKNFEFEVIENTCDQEIFYPKRNFLKTKPLKFLFVGRLNPQKNPDLLIKSFADLFKRNSFVKLDIVGDGSMRFDLEKMIEDLSLSSVVFFHGWKTDEEIAEFMRRSDCLLVPSDIESFGLVALESISCGTPIISSKTPSLIEIIDKTNGGIALENWQKDFIHRYEEVFEKKINFDKIKTWSEIAKDYSRVFSEETHY